MAFIQLKTYSETLRTKTSIQVILPTPLAGETNGSFYDSDRKFPTLYLLHGTYGDEGDYTRFSRIESYAQEYYVAVVMMSTACLLQICNGRASQNDGVDVPPFPQAGGPVHLRIVHGRHRRL